MRLVLFTLERNLELEKHHEIKYLDFNALNATGPAPLGGEILRFNPDLVIEREFNDSRMRYDAIFDWLRENTKIPTAVWLIDTHCILKRHKLYSRKFTHVFLAISAFVEPFRRWNPNTYWLPLCYPDRTDSIAAKDRPKLYDISFIGNFERKEQARRKKLLAIIRREFGERLFVKTDYENLHALIGASRVSFNCSVGGDLNFRVWEVLACGAELVTDEVPDLYKIAGLAGRVHIYNSTREMLELLHAVLDGRKTGDPAESRDWVRRAHSLVHRYEAMLRMIQTGRQERF